MPNELMNDKEYRIICDNQNYMQNINAENLQENPYVIITSDSSPWGAIASFVIYVKAERQEADGIYVFEHRDEMYYLDDIQAYECKFNQIYYYTPYTMCNYIPEIIRERKIICYDRSEVIDPLRNEIARMSDYHTELPCEIVEVKQLAKQKWPDLPDYEIETVVEQCGYDVDDFLPNALGEMNMIRCIYETLVNLNGGEQLRVI